MTIYFSDLKNAFWLRDGDEIVWCDTEAEAKRALRAIDARAEVADEVRKITEWLRSMGMNQAADAIEAKDYKRG